MKYIYVIVYCLIVMLIVVIYKSDYPLGVWQYVGVFRGSERANFESFAPSPPPILAMALLLIQCAAHWTAERVSAFS